MGILNVTNDSFYDGGKYVEEIQIINQVKKMLDEGAKIIDVGAQSSRPGASLSKEEDELKKLLPIIKLLKSNFKNIILSIDTYWSKVAEEAVKAGASIINDISAGEIDKKMFNTIAKLDVPYILMHMKDIPKNMQTDPNYDNVTECIFNFFKEKLKILENMGVNNIALDPGFGFGKTIEHNYILLNEFKKFKKLNKPLLVGLSRKSMIYKPLKIKPKNALNGTTILNTIALKNGANILRVHDVKEAVECIKISKLAQKNN
ncbi:MAG: dihydropteroate synthase [Flavobacteriales bacterium]|nr:dihydropteroate synthase [Flavobacteriales bacterium]